MTIKLCAVSTAAPLRHSNTKLPKFFTLHGNMIVSPTTARYKWPFVKNCGSSDPMTSPYDCCWCCCCCCVLMLSAKFWHRPVLRQMQKCYVNKLKVGGMGSECGEYEMRESFRLKLFKHRKKDKKNCWGKKLEPQQYVVNFRMLGHEMWRNKVMLWLLACMFILCLFNKMWLKYLSLCRCWWCFGIFFLNLIFSLSVCSVGLCKRCFELYLCFTKLLFSQIDEQKKKLKFLRFVDWKIIKFMKNFEFFLLKKVLIKI